MLNRQIVIVAVVAVFSSAAQAVIINVPGDSRAGRGSANTPGVPRVLRLGS